MPRLVGIDLGGTSIRAALATGPTTYAERVVRRRTPAAAGPEAVISACAAAARDAAGGTPDGIAIGIPGALNGPIVGDDSQIRRGGNAAAGHKPSNHIPIGVAPDDIRRAIAIEVPCALDRPARITSKSVDDAMVAPFMNQLL